MTIWQILDSKIGLLILGFILTTLAGGLISSWLQRASWKRQSCVDLYRKRYEEGTQFLNDLSKLLGDRFFLMQRFLWVLDDPREEKIKEIEIEYFKIVAAWNSIYWMNRNKIRLLIGEAQANLFLDYRDDARPDNPLSLHYKFVKAHQSVIKARKKELSVAAAQNDVYTLNHFCSYFLETLTTDFLKRAASLQLLEIPQSSEEQNRLPQAKQGDKQKE